MLTTEPPAKLLTLLPKHWKGGLQEHYGALGPKYNKIYRKPIYTAWKKNRQDFIKITMLN